MIRSLELSCSSRDWVADGFLDAMPGFIDLVVEDCLTVRDASFVPAAGDSVSGRSNSLSATIVAGVQVVVDDTDALTASADACNEAMSLIRCVVL
jgi:hypothetical protein